jgi:putative acetyltransferase
MNRIREENKNDYDAIKNVNDKAFHQPQEGNIIDKIRNTNTKMLSLVAEIDNKIVGHIFFSSTEIEGYPEIKDGMGLAPMSVIPEYQKQGIGKMLIDEGISILKKLSVPYIIVLGHEHYYPKFGFEKASKYSLKSQWDEVPDEAFMVMILDKERMKDVHGVVRYRDEWNEAI